VTDSDLFGCQGGAPLFEMAGATIEAADVPSDTVAVAWSSDNGCANRVDSPRLMTPGATHPAVVSEPIKGAAETSSEKPVAATPVSPACTRVRCFNEERNTSPTPYRDMAAEKNAAGSPSRSGEADESEAPVGCLSMISNRFWGFIEAINGSGRANSLGEGGLGRREFSYDDLSDEQKVRLRTTFDTFDHDRSGALSPDELTQVFMLLGHNMTKLDLATLMANADHDKSGLIDFKEFAHIWWEHERESMERDFESELNRAFEVFDLDGNGVLSEEEIRRTMTTIGEKLSDSEVEDLLKEVQPHMANGAIAFDDFKNLPFWR